MTQTPASRPFELSTVPLMKPCGARGVGDCAWRTAINPADATVATPSAIAMRVGTMFIESLLVRITRFRYSTCSLRGRDIVGESAGGVKVSRCKVTAHERQLSAPGRRRQPPPVLD